MYSRISYGRFLIFALAAISACAFSACGKRRAPQPPRERVLQRVEISGYQRGDQVILSWKMPARNAAKNSVLNISRADIYRLVEPIDAPLQLSEEEFATRSTLIAALAITDSDFGNKTLTHRDTLQFAGQPARLRYAIRLVNASGQKAGFSNALLLEPASKVAAPPAGLRARATDEAVELEWSAPAANIDNSTPVSILGYNVYRSNSEKEPAKLLNKTPIAATSFRDEFFDFDKDYFYFVRSVSAGLLAEPVESTESNIVRFKAIDTFAPSAPDAVTVAASPTSISIFFAVNPEKDVAGYKIYRSEDKDKPLAQWDSITATPITNNTFQDAAVEGGKTYFYYVTAVDKRGNVSEPSEVVSDTVP